ncbi:hypothetical protein GOPIP_010_00720 [Gordonia polyisoprenivorans NBRC 16320 = JCM 10675]|nr:hypothetical protein GOPIP_010_00720 [Gordonia polyisoprenivorans NBRC 16320 = JCM 10675]
MWRVHEPPRPRKIAELDLWTLFTAHPGQEPTLYLMTQEGAESSGPIVAAMVDQVFKLADLASSAHGGRLEPPMTVVLDEAANICRIDDLPAKASHLGSKVVLVDGSCSRISRGWVCGAGNGWAHCGVPQPAGSSAPASKKRQTPEWCRI